jgi:hypothetical protein
MRSIPRIINQVLVPAVSSIFAAVAAVLTAVAHVLTRVATILDPITDAAVVPRVAPVLAGVPAIFGAIPPVFAPVAHVLAPVRARAVPIGARLRQERRGRHQRQYQSLQNHSSSHLSLLFRASPAEASGEGGPPSTQRAPPAWTARLWPALLRYTALMPPGRLKPK